MNFASYKNNLPYPKKPIKPTQDIRTAAQAREFVAIMEKYESDLEQYLEHKKEYDDNEAFLQENFKRDAIFEAGLTGHPKAEKAWSMAWERGHSDSFEEILYNLQDLATLLVD